MKDGNLLYEYAEILCGARTKFCSYIIGDVRAKDDDSIEARNSQRDACCENALKLVYFAFRYIYKCKTYEEALQHPEVWKKADLERLISSQYFVVPSIASFASGKMHYVQNRDLILWLAYAPEGEGGRVAPNLARFYRFAAEGGIGRGLAGAKAEVKAIDELLKKR